MTRFMFLALFGLALLHVSESKRVQVSQHERARLRPVEPALVAANAENCGGNFDEAKRIEAWKCAWCEEKYKAGQDVWMLHVPEAITMEEHEKARKKDGYQKGKTEDVSADFIAEGGYFQVYKAYSYGCPATQGAFLTPTEEHKDSAAEMLVKYKEASTLVRNIPEMMPPLAFGPNVGNRDEMQSAWSGKGMIFPLMQGTLHKWMNERMSGANIEERKGVTMQQQRSASRKLLYRCLPVIAKWLTNVVLKLHGAGLAHCDIKPENVLVKYTGDECPRPLMADYDGLARPGAKTCISTEQYGHPVGDKTPMVIDWRESFATIIEMYNPDILESGGMSSMFGGNESSFAETLYEKAETTWADEFQVEDGIYGLEPESLKNVLGLKDLIAAIYSAGRVDEEEALSLEAEEAKIRDIIGAAKTPTSALEKGHTAGTPEEDAFADMTGRPFQETDHITAEDMKRNLMKDGASAEDVEHNFAGLDEDLKKSLEGEGMSFEQFKERFNGDEDEEDEEDEGAN